MTSYETSSSKGLSEQEQLWALGLLLMPGVGAVTARRLIAFCGGLEGVYHRNAEALRQIPGIGPAISRAVERNKVLQQAEKEMAFAQRNAIRIICYLDTDYPARLKHCDDGPVVLFFKGMAGLNPERVVSIVGTRKPSEHGRKFTRELVNGLAGNAGQVISGLAYGIDAEAHRAAIEAGVPTIAVLAHGLDRIYPAMHTKLAQQMLERGGWISDFASGTLPDRENFPKRNRIIAGLSDAVIVVEAASKGGALITANLAQDYNRDVFAIPGRPDDLMSEGCNRIIRENKAGLVTSASDILYAMRWDQQSRHAKPQQSLFPVGDPEAERLWELLSEPRRMDYLISMSGLSQGRISAILLGMELDGIIHVLPGSRWARG